MVRCMQRTNIYLEDRQTEALDRLAKGEGVSRAEIIRRLLDQALDGGDNRIDGDLHKIDVSFGIDLTYGVASRKAGEREAHLEHMWQTTP